MILRFLLLKGSGNIGKELDKGLDGFIDVGIAGSINNVALGDGGYILEGLGIVNNIGSRLGTLCAYAGISVQNKNVVGIALGNRIKQKKPTNNVIDVSL